MTAFSKCFPQLNFMSHSRAQTANMFSCFHSGSWAPSCSLHSNWPWKVNLKCLLGYECTWCSPSCAELEKNTSLLGESMEETKLLYGRASSSSMESIQHTIKPRLTTSTDWKACGAHTVSLYQWFPSLSPFLSFFLSFSKCSVCNTKDIKYIKLSVEYRELMCNFLIFKMTATNSKQNYYSIRTLKCIFSGISGKFLSERIKPIINSRTFDYFPFLNHWWICLRKPPRCCSKPCKLFTENKPFQMTAWAQFPRAAGHNRGWL